MNDLVSIILPKIFKFSLVCNTYIDTQSIIIFSFYIPTYVNLGQ